MTANECITGRRSIRSFTDQPVSHELLSQIIETASFAPSWKNTQITRYIAVEGAKKSELAKCTSIFPGNGGYERDGSFSTVKGDGWQMYDAGVASEAFCLAAYEQGLGTVIMGLFDQDEASKVLNIPQERELVALIPIGYPAESPAAPKRKTVEDLLTFQE